MIEPRDARILHRAFHKWLPAEPRAAIWLRMVEHVTAGGGISGPAGGGSRSIFSSKRFSKDFLK